MLILLYAKNTTLSFKLADVFHRILHKSKLTGKTFFLTNEND